jgi:hypothetical protein
MASTIAEPQLTEQQITNKSNSFAFYLGERRITTAFSLESSRWVQNMSINRSKESNDA